MKNPSRKPVIFLAFANDHQSYLYKLTKERESIRNALESIEHTEEKPGLCKVIPESEIGVDRIFKVFDNYQDRIVIFHYGGHANDYSLLLKEASGKNQSAFSAGLMPFLADQKGLKLVFINGCSTKDQAEELIRLGVPAVIATTQPVDDAAAQMLSEQFYKSLAAGRTIEQAWKAAKKKVKTQTDASKGYRAVWPGKSRRTFKQISFPWELYIRPGAEAVKDWNLPEAANDPLSSLPLPEEYYKNLPPDPFLGLHYFQKKHAAIFFGRGQQIHKLYNCIIGGDPIIRFYGKSGVGKSSLLYAGLLPRIEDKFIVLYARRDETLGLLGTLNQQLNEYLKIRKKDPLEAPGTENITQKWKRIEQESIKKDDKRKKPLIVILDQVEEIFTRGMLENENARDELTDFLRVLKPLFAGTDNIQGKLILSYRKEYDPDISDKLRSLELSNVGCYLKPLDRPGILEAVEGVTRKKKLNTKYQITIKKSPKGQLPENIAYDLLKDSESAIAPILQIILKKLYKSAKQDDDTACLTIELYQELKKEGIAIGEFFKQQMALLAKEMPQEVASGLALDLLKNHTTDLDTAGRCSQKELAEYYPGRSNIIEKLIKKCESLSLLLRIDKNNTVLAHDILAPAVSREYNISDKPGQRAMRVLSNRSHGWEDGKTGELLDKQDMRVLNAGKAGCRDLNEDEKRILAASKEAQKQNRRELQRWIAAAAAVPLVIAALAWLIFQYNSAYISLAKPEFEWSREEIQFTRGAPFEDAVTTGFYGEDIRSQKIRSDIGANLNIGFGERNDWSQLSNYLSTASSAKHLITTGKSKAGIDSLFTLIEFDTISVYSENNLVNYSLTLEVLDKIAIGNTDAIKAFIVKLENEHIMQIVLATYALGKIAIGNADAIRAVIAKLYDENNEIRGAAAVALGKIAIDNADAIRALIGKLGDENNEIRSAAADALGDIAFGNADAIRVVIAKLDDENNEICKAAADALSKIAIGNADAIRALIGKLEDDEVFVRSAAADALGDIAFGNVDAIRALVGKLGDKYIRFTAVGALGDIAIGNADAIRALIGKLEDDEVFVRSAAARALGDIAIGNADAIRALIGKLGDKYIGFTAARALGDIAIGNADAIRALIGKLGDENNEIRSAAARALGDIAIGNADAIRALIGKLGDKYIGFTAARALGDIAIGNADAIRALIGKLEDDEVFVRSAAARALGDIAIGNADAIRALIGKLEDDEVFVRSAAADALGDIAIGNADAIRALIEKLGDENNEILSAAVGALGDIAIGNADAIRALIEKLGDENNEILSAVAGALGDIAIGNADAIRALIGKLEDENNQIREAVAGALGRIAVGNDVVIKQFTIAMKDNSEEVSSIATEILPKLLGEKPVNDLLEMFEYAEYGYRYGAAYALTRKKVLDVFLIEEIADLKNDSRPWVSMAAWYAYYLIQKRRLQEAQADVLLKKAAESKENENFYIAEMHFQSAADTLRNIVVIDSAKLGNALLQQTSCRVAYGYPYDLERLLDEALRFQPALKNSEEYSAIRKAMENINK